MNESTLSPQVRPLYLVPQLNLSRSTAFRMRMLSICALLAIIQSSLSDNFASLFIALSACGAAFLTELLLFYRTKRAAVIRDGSSLVTALVLSLLLPNTINPVYAAIGTFFAIAIVKHSFGGLGANWLNPAVGGWLFVRFSWPQLFAPLVPAARAGESFFDGGLRSVLNALGAALPQGYIDFFFNARAGMIVDRGVLGFMVGLILLCSTQACRAWLSVTYLAMFALFIRVLSSMDVLLGLLSGGTLAAAFLLTVDPGTAAKSQAGAVVLALLAGAAAGIFRYAGGEAYGVVYAAALVNVLVPLVRSIESKYSAKRRCP
ncbi:RnfABCDGE type electron transport complex subunit D [Breznakiellaceae bacterium SP9]